MGQFAIGTDDFVKFKEKSAYYIDKSLFVKEIIDDTNEVLLITRPRRFGKTLNMSMLNSYLAYNNDENYTHLFNDLKIWDAGEKYTDHFQDTPTIFFTMKNVCCDNWDECYLMLVIMISEIFRDKLYLKESLSASDKEVFDKILNQDKEQTGYYKNSLLYLTRWLYEYHNKKVYLVIDEYDTPIHEGYQNRYYKKIINFIQVFFGAAMKSNKYLEKAVLTGITRIAGESLFSKLNSFVSYNIRKKQFNEFFGFKEEETIIAVEKFSPNRKMEAIRKMYNGYLIGGMSMYNPWSIMNVLDSDELEPLQPYWYNTSSDSLIRRQFAKKTHGVKEALSRLVSGGTITRKIKDEVTYLDLADSGDAVWSFLLYSGYLTLNKYEMNKDRTYELCIPNEEVRGLMQNIIENWFSEGLSVDDINMFLEAMLTGKADSLKNQLSIMMKRSFSYFDITRTMPEAVYQSYILGMLMYLDRDYYCESNPVMGEGRCDILICPKAGVFKETGVILEFKKTDDEMKLDQITESALLQIKERNYIEGARKRGIKTIYCYGIGFYKAELMLKMEKVDLSDTAKQYS